MFNIFSMGTCKAACVTALEGSYAYHYTTNTYCVTILNLKPLQVFFGSRIYQEEKGILESCQHTAESLQFMNELCSER